MGLFSKLKSRLGSLGVRVSKISARFTSRLSPRTISFLGRAGRITKPIARIGTKVARFTPIGRAVSVGLLAVTGVSALRRRAKKKRAPSVAGISTASQVGRLAGIKRAGLIAAGVGAAAFVAEQIAEKLGVRGGAGFVGKRPSVTRAPTKRRKRRKKKSKRIPRHRHKIVRRPARTVVRSIRRKKSKSRKGTRVSFTTKQGKKVSFIAR